MTKLLKSTTGIDFNYQLRFSRVFSELQIIAMDKVTRKILSTTRWDYSKAMELELMNDLDELEYKVVAAVA